MKGLKAEDFHAARQFLRTVYMAGRRYPTLFRGKLDSVSSTSLGSIQAPFWNLFSICRAGDCRRGGEKQVRLGDA